MTKEFSELDVCKKFKHKDKAKIITYIEAMYNRKSPLNKIQELENRKQAACEKAKLNPNEDWVIKMMNFEDESISELVFVYLGIFQNSNRYHKLMSDQQLYWSMMKLIFKPFDEDTLSDEDKAEQKMKLRNSISDQADKLLTKIEYSYSQIYGTNDVIEMAEMHVRKLLTPELRLLQKEA